MKKLTYHESSNIYGGMAFAAFITIIMEVATSITAIIKMANSDNGSTEKTSTGNEIKWESNNSGDKSQSPAFFGY